MGDFLRRKPAKVIKSRKWLRKLFFLTLFLIVVTCAAYISRESLIPWTVTKLQMVIFKVFGADSTILEKVGGADIDPAVYFELGNNALDKEELDTALFYFRKALVLYPQDPTVVFYIGLTYHLKKEYRLAISYYLNAVSMTDNKDFKEKIYLGVSDAYYRLGDQDRSQFYFDISSQVSLGLKYQPKEKEPLVIKAHERKKVKAKEPPTIADRLDEASKLLSQGRHDDALNKYDEIIKDTNGVGFIARRAIIAKYNILLLKREKQKAYDLLLYLRLRNQENNNKK